MYSYIPVYYEYTVLVYSSQFVAHFLLLAGVNLLGVSYNYLKELAQRKTFSETRRYISALIKIDEQKVKKVSPPPPHTHTHMHCIVIFLIDFLDGLLMWWWVEASVVSANGLESTLNVNQESVNYL